MSESPVAKYIAHEGQARHEEQHNARNLSRVAVQK